MTHKIAALDQFYPADALFCARTTRDVMRWNVPDITRLPEYRLDATPAQLAGFAGTLPFIAHEAAVTPVALDFMLHCGLPGASDLHVYRTVQEAEDLALELMEKGLRLAYNFGTLPGLEARDDQHLVAPDLYATLNAKQSLDTLVPPENVAPRVVLEPGATALPDVEGIKPPVYVKLAGGHSTGGGAGVFHCSDDAALAGTLQQLSTQLAAGDALVVETDCKAVASWCAGVAILDDRVEWLGASCQVFDAPARQIANEAGGRTMPDRVKDISLQISSKAMAAGFRGIAGFDIGECEDGSFTAFDLNFRPNSSTGLLLAHDAVRQRTGLPLMYSFYLHHDGPVAALLDVVEADAAAGRVVPGSVFDAPTYGATLDDPATRSCLDGWLAAETREEAVAWIKAVQNRLAEKGPRGR
ncbi:MAG: hypothetical protein R3287_11435 [Anderseniella sp.]|nr:hypothetical protein [Anderseniella sp.]